MHIQSFKISRLLEENVSIQYPIMYNVYNSHCTSAKYASTSNLFIHCNNFDVANIEARLLGFAVQKHCASSASFGVRYVSSQTIDITCT